MTHVRHAGELTNFGVAGVQIEVLDFFSDGTNGARLKTSPAFAAIVFADFIGFEFEIGQNRNKPVLRAISGINQQIVASPPAQSRFESDFPM